MWTASLDPLRYTRHLVETSAPPVRAKTQSFQGRAVTNELLADLVETVAASQDRGAFAHLFQHFAPKLKSFGLRRGDSDAMAEELAQETMLTVWRKAATFDRSKANVSTWIFTIVRNKRIDMFRRRPFLEVVSDDGSDHQDMEVDDSERPDEALESSQTANFLQEAITYLPAEQKLVLTKAFFEEKSHSEIAEELSLPLGTVKSRIRLALSRLRGSVGDEMR
jgi:RNA polymerase sigma-70 factor (ECF subfamily)